MGPSVACRSHLRADGEGAVRLARPGEGAHGSLRRVKEGFGRGAASATEDRQTLIFPSKRESLGKFLLGERVLSRRNSESFKPNDQRKVSHSWREETRFTATPLIQGNSALKVSAKLTVPLGDNALLANLAIADSGASHAFLPSSALQPVGLSATCRWRSSGY